MFQGVSDFREEPKTETPGFYNLICKMMYHHFCYNLCVKGMNTKRQGSLWPILALAGGYHSSYLEFFMDDSHQLLTIKCTESHYKHMEKSAPVCPEGPKNIGQGDVMLHSGPRRMNEICRMHGRALACSKLSKHCSPAYPTCLVNLITSKLSLRANME